MSDQSLPWIERYRPQSLKEILGNREVLTGLQKWLDTWQKGPPVKRGALLIGPPGVGKTATALALARDNDMEIVEFNASDKRNKSVIEEQVLQAATQQTLDGGLRLILLDEVDGLSGTQDRGGTGAILRLLDVTMHPVIMTANDPTSKVIKDLEKASRIFKFGPIGEEDMITVLERIIQDQHIEISNEILEFIIDNSRGDLRAAISDLETFVHGVGPTGEVTFTPRDIRRTVEETIRRLMMTTSAQAAKRVISEADVDYEKLLLWVEENIHKHRETLVELEKAYDALSMADYLIGKIGMDQNWKLLSYVYDFLSMGIAASRQTTTYHRTTYTEPAWPLLVWKGKRKRDRRRDLTKRLSIVMGVSGEEIQQTILHTIDTIERRNPKMKNSITMWLKKESGAIMEKR